MEFFPDGVRVAVPSFHKLLHALGLNARLNPGWWEVKYALPSKISGAYFRVESTAAQKYQPITFAVLRTRLLQVVNGRIRNGEFTERGLARLVGLSQPQVHNLLKGARRLSSDTADLLMARLGISILDLIADVINGKEAGEHALFGPQEASPVLAVIVPARKQTVSFPTPLVGAKQAS